MFSLIGMSRFASLFIFLTFLVDFFFFFHHTVLRPLHPNPLCFHLHLHHFFHTAEHITLNPPLYLSLLPVASPFHLGPSHSHPHTLSHSLTPPHTPCLAVAHLHSSSFQGLRLPPLWLFLHLLPALTADHNVFRNIKFPSDLVCPPVHHHLTHAQCLLHLLNLLVMHFDLLFSFCTCTACICGLTLAF